MVLHTCNACRNCNDCNTCNSSSPTRFGLQDTVPVTSEIVVATFYAFILAPVLNYQVSPASPAYRSFNRDLSLQSRNASETTLKVSDEANSISVLTLEGRVFTEGLESCCPCKSTGGEPFESYQKALRAAGQAEEPRLSSRGVSGRRAKVGRACLSWLEKPFPNVQTPVLGLKPRLNPGLRVIASS
jgi:hypothetical protein